jgi:site-specific DNA-methyltransferase (adenine-specific)
MKPNEGSYANNALKWGVAGLNVDGGRIEHNEDLSIKREGTKKLDTNNQGWGFKAVSRDNKGRFPANIILDEEVCNEAGEWKRYFYCAKASKKERNRGCEGLEEQVTQGMRNNAGPALVGENYNRTKLKNNHPTVKPLALMKYLVTLTMMPNPEQVYLDPFCGSGTTLMACKELGRNYIGIEKEEEYIKIARNRVNATPEPLFV